MLDRYLYAVRNDLPKGVAADDIVAEIADELQSQMEAREGTLGRPLTEDEFAEMLKAYGHPRVVAARYGRVQYLIGPALLPFYWSALSTVATIVVAIELVAGGISAVITHDGVVFFSALGAAWNSLIWIFGIVTVVFALGERTQPRDGRPGIISLGWDPRRLPAPGVLPPVPRSSALVEFVANFIALLVLLDAPGPHRIPLDAIVAGVLDGMHASLTQAWHGAYVGLLAGTALLALAAIAAFVWPRLAVAHESARLIASVVAGVGIAFTLQAGPWIRPSDNTLNAAALYTLVGAIAILALQVVISARALVRRPAPAIS
jgi:hypothetical protein